MKDHNKVIIQALNDYLKIGKPGFAILIKGDWGSGKSFLIKQWKKDVEDRLKKNSEDTEDGEVIHLNPIYVSLNGVSSVSQIDDSLKKAISPFLHGKFMKGLGKALKLAASMALRVNVDIVGDEKPEQVVCTIDPKTLLEFDPTKVKGQRILIFDDIERAKLPVAEVLGYINYFVEQVGCHVIIVGDDTKVRDLSYTVIKEKTIGHEYRVEPETDEALDLFIKEVDKNGKTGLGEKKRLIYNCFIVSGVRNLRILRQCLYDYKVYLSHLQKDITSADEFEYIKDCLLANFIIVYAEYKNGQLLMENFNQQLVLENINLAAARQSNKEAPKETPAIDIQSKYDKAGITNSYRVLAQGYVECVMNYLLNGVINKSFLLSEVKRDKKTPWEKLANYHILTNNEFSECLNQTVIHLQTGDFDSLDVMLMATCCVLTVIKQEMTSDYTVDQVFGWSTKFIEEKYFSSCKTLDDLYTMRTHAHQCLGYYLDENCAEEGKRLNSQIEVIFESYVPKVNNKLTDILNALTDNNVKELYSVYKGSIPDHTVTYSMYSIFSQVDPVRFANGFLKLSNYSKTEFIQFVKYHYYQAFSPVNAKEFIHYYEADLKKLPDIVKLLKEAADKEYLVDKKNIMDLAKALTESGDTIQVLVFERDKKSDV